MTKALDANHILRNHGADALRDHLDNAVKDEQAKAERNKKTNRTNNKKSAPLGKDPGPRCNGAWIKDAINAEQLRGKKFPPLKFIIAPYVPAEGLTILASRPKLGKSWLVLDVCLGVTADWFVLGEIKPTPGLFNALYMNLIDWRAGKPPMAMRYRALATFWV